MCLISHGFEECDQRYVGDASKEEEAREEEKRYEREGEK
jgi:hypothetical protein